MLSCWTGKHILAEIPRAVNQIETVVRDLIFFSPHNDIKVLRKPSFSYSLQFEKKKRKIPICLV